MIVVAHDISPADMLQFRDGAFIGFVTAVGGQNSHTAIVARSLRYSCRWLACRLALRLSRKMIG